MCRIFKRVFFKSDRKKEIDLNSTEQVMNQEHQQVPNDSEFANLKEIAQMQENNSFRNSFVSETDLIQHFFNEFNNWMNNHINLYFSKYYSANYQELIDFDTKKLEDKDLEVFRYQQIIEKSVKDPEVKGASFELFTGAISMSDYTKKTLKVLKIEMDAIHGVDDNNSEAINDIKERINALIMRYNTDYDKYFRSLTSIRLKFMKAIEAYLTRFKSMTEN